jgi:D-alanyl-D-alanine carboxypeptidase (penicillin-binding protein 5/6)
MEQPNHSDHDYHVADQMDQPSPKNMLWGLIFALLTFLVVVICALSIQMIKQEADDFTFLPPQDQNDPDVPPLVDPDKQQPSQDPGKTDPTTPTDPTPGVDNPPAPESFLIKKTAATQTMEQRVGEMMTGIYSKKGLLVDLADNTIIAESNVDTMIYPASMTKVMTLLVAAEELESSAYDEYITISEAIVVEMERQGASGIRLKVGEELKVRDLMYLVGMESDGVAAMQLAEYVAGSQEAFVAKMNAKCRELELMSTHFVNATGLHDENHYSTCREIASIMAAAMANGNVSQYLCEEQYYLDTNLRDTYIYHTYYHDMSPVIKWFSLPDGAKVIAAKTGWTPEAGYCLVTCVASVSGKKYVVVTADAMNDDSYCADLEYIYETYANQLAYGN